MPQCIIVLEGPTVHQLQAAKVCIWWTAVHTAKYVLVFCREVIAPGCSAGEKQNNILHGYDVGSLNSQLLYTVKLNPAV